MGGSQLKLKHRWKQRLPTVVTPSFQPSTPSMQVLHISSQLYERVHADLKLNPKPSNKRLTSTASSTHLYAQATWHVEAYLRLSLFTFSSMGMVRIRVCHMAAL